MAIYGYPNHGLSLAHHSNTDFTTAENDRNSFVVAITGVFYVL
jgi:hypothetical protein